MQKLHVVKAIVRYQPSVNTTPKFRYGNGENGSSTRYLLLKKQEDENPEAIGKWECAGGRIKPRETPLEAIAREIKEEIGIEIGRNAKIFKQFPTLKDISKRYDLECDVYLIEAYSMTIKLSSEHSDYAWKKAEEVKNMNLVPYANLLLEFFNNPEKYLI